MGDTERIVSDEFPELFHYTNIPAFLNIYKTGKLWATHYQDLNDTTEFTRFRRKVQRFICPIIRDIFDRQMQRDADFAADVNSRGGIDIVVAKETENSLDSVHRNTFGKEMYKQTFICSFCAHTQPDEVRDGLLSQWRGYGEGGGVAIVLDATRLEAMLQCEYDRFQIKNISTIATVIYDNNSNASTIEQKFENVFTYFPKILAEVFPEKGFCDNNKLQSYFEAMHNDFLLGSIRVKHNGFHEENEIRIVVPITTTDSYSYNPEDPKPLKEIRYRQRGSCEVRYIELFGAMPLPIKRIIVGPSRIQNFNHQSIKDAVEPHIKVEKSTIPFAG